MNIRPKNPPNWQTLVFSMMVGRMKIAEYQFWEVSWTKKKLPASFIFLPWGGKGTYKSRCGWSVQRGFLDGMGGISGGGGAQP